MYFLERLLPYLNSLVFDILWLGGIVYAVGNRRKHPRTSLCAAIGFGILLLTSLTADTAYAYLEYQISAVGSTLNYKYVEWMNSVPLCTFPFRILAWGFLLAAIFGWKNVREHEMLNSHTG